MSPTLPQAITPLTPESFFRAWRNVCQANRDRLLENWENGGHYTSVIFGDRNQSITVLVGTELGLECYSNYYSLDAVYFRRSDDAVTSPTAPEGSTWLQNIRIAFEHENYFRSGLFQETSHLMITRAELRVLVTYPEAYDEAEVDEELSRLAAIITRSGLPDPAFLLIMGKRTGVGRGDWSGIHWIGRKFAAQGWVEIPY